MQERLTMNIADAMERRLKPLAVGVVLRCRHMCLESRGVQKTGTITYTSALRGAFKAEASAREESCASSRLLMQGLPVCEIYLWLCAIRERERVGGQPY